MSGCRFPLCADLCAAKAHCRKMFAETRSILLPVLLSIGLTQAAWVGIYDCQVTRNIFLNETGSATEGIANAAMAMAVIALVSGLMITLAIWHFKRLVKSWLALSCVVCSFVIAGAIFQDGAALVPVDERVQLAIGGTATAVYGGGAVLAFFTKHLPASCHQLYVVSTVVGGVRLESIYRSLTVILPYPSLTVIHFPITNCSAIATFYLTCLPGCTAWFLLAAVVLWDIFAVLAPIGPLKLALERSQDYGADVLRFMMFTAESGESVQQQPVAAAAAPAADAAGDAVADDDDAAAAGDEEERLVRPRLSAGRDQLRQDPDTSSPVSSVPSLSLEETTSGSTSSDGSGDTGIEEEKVEEKGEEEEGPNAREALNSGSHLGFGDFIFYSILVGSSMAVGVLPALSSTLGVLVGLAYTLSIPSEQETLPALPISIVFGMASHFYTLAQMTALRYVYEYLTA